MPKRIVKSASNYAGQRPSKGRYKVKRARMMPYSYQSVKRVTPALVNDMIEKRLHSGKS